MHGGDDRTVTVIAGVGTALGAHAYPQEQITDAFVRYVLGDVTGAAHRRNACAASMATAVCAPGTSRSRWTTTEPLDGFTGRQRRVARRGGGAR